MAEAARAAEQDGRRRRLYALAHAAGKAIPGGVRVQQGVAQGLLTLVASLVAFLPTRWVGVHEGYWAALTAITVTQLTFVQTRSVGRDQLAGALIGGAVGGAVALAAGTGLVAFAAAVPIAIVAASALNFASAARIAATTATIVLLVPHPHVSVDRMVLARLGEVTWGAACGIAVAALAERIERLLGWRTGDA